MTATLRPASPQEAVSMVREHARIRPLGGGTKPALSRADDGARLVDLSSLQGIVEYDPEEFTFTALSGTPIREIVELLRAQGQCLPFDPPLQRAGATLGGTVAAGLSGPGRLRYGGVRDFILGVRFIDGSGSLVRGGGKVVKNVAGFDLPKLLVGSLGRLGILVELTFKVFPRPPSSLTLRLRTGSLAEAVETSLEVMRGPWEVDTLDLKPPGDLLLRLAGRPEALEARAQRLVKSLDRAAERLEAAAGESLWEGLREFDWADREALLVKVPLTPAPIVKLDTRLQQAGIRRRYSAAGNVAWLAPPAGPVFQELNGILQEFSLQGLVLRGACDNPWIGPGRESQWLRRVKEALDPEGRFGEF